MHTLLVAINARYIHTNNAVRLLKANSSFEIDFWECTIHDDQNSIYQKIIDLNPDVIGFSTYIWNATMITSLVKKIKKETNIYVILGGPEVSYDAPFYLKETGADVIVRGEGEFVVDDIIHCVTNKKPLDDVNNVSFIHQGQLIENPIKVVEDLASLTSPHHFMDDTLNTKNRINYIESSRGCPYRCSYCLSSLESNVRFFPVDIVKRDLLHLLNHGAKTFKFLDRTFNANKQTKSIIDFIIQHHREGSVFQFEITGDVLDPALIEHINNHAPAGLFRFEIGIQSTNPLTNRLVDRIQNNEKLFTNIKKIQDAKIIDLHLDLIAGLPKEDLTSFIKTFNHVFFLAPKELQLGFLKLLRGTKIRRETFKYGYLYQSTPPYEIIGNDDLSKEDLLTIKKVEKMLNIFHNKGHFDDFVTTLAIESENPFNYFLKLYEDTQKYHLPEPNYQMIDLYKIIDSQLTNSDDHDALLILYLSKFKVRPKCYFPLIQDKPIKKQCFSALSHQTNIPIDTLYRNAFIAKRTSDYVIALYQNQQCSTHIVKL